MTFELPGSTMRICPRVSVIIPTYNRGHFIGDAIASVLSQDFADFELIVVDDGSTDQTEAAVLKFSDARVIYVRQENSGRSHARNRALALSRGGYIAFLDSDDMYLPGKLSLQVDYLDRHSSVGMVYTSAHCVDYSGNPLKDNYIASVSGWIYGSVAFFRPVTITLPTVMARRELFTLAGQFDENMHRFEDTDMWRRISKITQINALPAFTCKLRTHADNTLASQNPKQIMSALDYYVEKILREDQVIKPWTRNRGIGNLYYYYARAFLTVPEWNNLGRGLLTLSYQFWPTLRIHMAFTATWYRILGSYYQVKSRLGRALRGLY